MGFFTKPRDLSLNFATGLCPKEIYSKMTKTSKRKLIVTSALVLGAVATVGATFGALILNGGDKTDTGQLGIGSVEIKNQVVSLEVSVTDDTIVLDGQEPEDSYTASDLLHGDTQNDREFTLEFKVTGDPRAWASLTVSFGWDDGKDAAQTYLTLPGEDTVSQASASAVGSGSTAVWTFSKAYTLNWETSTYGGGIVKYINDQYKDSKNYTAASTDLDKFKAAVEASSLTATVAVNLATGA